jgi:ribosomal protein L7/L12
MSTVKITTTKNGSFKIETHDAIIFATLEEAKQLADKLPMYIEKLEAVNQQREALKGQIARAGFLVGAE